MQISKSRLPWIVAAPLVLATLIVSAAELGPRHQPSGVDFLAPLGALTFDAYVAKTQALIAAGRPDLTPTNRAWVLGGNSPYSLSPTADCPSAANGRHRRGIVLLHGLTDSPYSTRALGKFFNSRCFRVMVPLLPGHGTRPGDLLAATWQDWTATVDYALARLRDEVDEVYLAGFSMGGTLALHQLLAHSSDRQAIRALFLFAPAVAVDAKAVLACPIAALSKLFARGRWLDLRLDEDPYKYQSFAFNAVCQLHRLIGEIAPASATRPIEVPLFVAASAQDTTVSFAATRALFRHARSRKKRMLVYTDGVAGEPMPGVTYVSSRIAGSKILSSAHTGIVVSPDDPHYGAQGDYKACNHYYDADQPSYRRCKAGNEDLLGEITEAHLSQGVVRRLTFNAQFDAMLNAMEEFLRSLEDATKQAPS